MPMSEQVGLGVTPGTDPLPEPCDGSKEGVPDGAVEPGTTGAPVGISEGDVLGAIDGCVLGATVVSAIELKFMTVILTKGTSSTNLGLKS